MRRASWWMGMLCVAACGGSDGRSDALVTAQSTSCTTGGAATASIDGVDASASDADPNAPAGWNVKLGGGGAVAVDASFSLGATPAPGTYGSGASPSFVTVSTKSGKWYAGAIGLFGIAQGGSFSLSLQQVTPAPHGTLQATLVPFTGGSGAQMTLHCAF